MRLGFHKMSGAGNDFILVDNRDSALDQLLNEGTIRGLCIRGLSVGADGLLEMRSDDEYPFRMKYYNSDGREAEMCGNGGRCIAGFAALCGIVPMGKSFRFRSDAGIHMAEVTEPGSARLWMTRPEIHFVNRILEVDSHELEVSFVDTGVPHAVVFNGDLFENGFRNIAPALRRHGIFGEAGANVDFVRRGEGPLMEMRTWERGVEGETLACGTGAVAVAICAELVLGADIPLDLRVRSGKILNVGRDSHGWWLSGEARMVYTGEVPDLEELSLTVGS